MTNLAPTRRMIGAFFFLFLFAGMWGCVDTAEPTGPVPKPEPDPGELTSVAQPAYDPASVAGRPDPRAPTTAPTPGS